MCGDDVQTMNRFVYILSHIRCVSIYISHYSIDIGFFFSILICKTGGYAYYNNNILQSCNKAI